MSKILCLLSLLFIDPLASALSVSPACGQLVSRELNLLEMGSFERPAETVVLKENTGHHGIDFIRMTRSGSQIVGLTDFLTITNKIYVVHPLPDVDGIEQKNIYINNACLIAGVQLIVRGKTVFITPETCTDSESFDQLVEHQCDFYRSYFGTVTR